MSPGRKISGCACSSAPSISATRAASWSRSPATPPRSTRRRSGFDRALAVTFGVLAVVLLLTTMFQVRFGLAPLKRISDSLAAIRSGAAERLRRRLPGRDRAAGARDQCADRRQPRDRRARAHPCRQSRACAEDAALGDDERGDRTRRRSARRQGARADRDHARPGRAPSRARAARGARRPWSAPSPKCAPVVTALARTDGEDPPRPRHRDRHRGAARHALPRRAAGPRGDGRQPGRQCLQMGAVARRDRSAARARRGRGARRLRIVVDDDGPGLTATQREQVARRGRPGSTRPSRARGWGCRSWSSSRRSMAAR